MPATLDHTTGTQRRMGQTRSAALTVIDDCHTLQITSQGLFGGSPPPPGMAAAATNSDIYRVDAQMILPLQVRCTMDPSSFATTSIIGSGGHHHHADVRRPHGGFPSSMTYISLHISAATRPPSFRLPLRSTCFASPSSAPTAHPASGHRGLGFKDSRNMAAVRPKLAVLPSGGAAYARSMLGSPASDFLDMRSNPASPAVESVSAISKGKVSSALSCALRDAGAHGAGIYNRLFLCRSPA